MSRLKVDSRLRKVCNHIYYQPTEATRLQYPCILYEDQAPSSVFANNKRYRAIPSYRATVIVKEPDSKLNQELVDEFDPSISYDTRYVSDNLYHTSWIINDDTGSNEPK